MKGDRPRTRRNICLVPAAGLVLLFLIVVTGARGAGAGELHGALDAFTGEWEGEVKIHALDGFLLRTVKAERRYVWDGSTQIVETRFKDGDSTYTTTARQTVQLGRLEASVTRPGMPPEQYGGAIGDGGIVWTNVERNSRDYRERVISRGDLRVVEGSSFEIMRLSDISGLVRVVFSFEARTPAPLPVVSNGAESAAQVAQLERELDASRAELKATEQSRAEAVRVRDDLGDRLARAEADVQGLEVERSALGRRAAEADRELAQLRSELQVAAEKGELASEMARQGQRDNEAMARRLAQLEAERDTLHARVESVERSAAGVSTERTEIEASRASLEGQLAGIRDDLERAGARGDESARQNAVLRLEREQLAARLAEAEQALAARSSHEGENTALAARLAAREVELAETRSQLDQAVKAGEGRQSEVGTLESELAALRADHAAFERQVVALRQIEQESSGRATELAAVSRRLDEAVQLRDQLAVENLDHARRAEQARADLVATRSSAGAEAERAGQLARELAAAKEARESRERELASLRANLASANNRTSDLADALRRAEAASAQLSKRFEEVQRDNEALVRRATELESRLASVQPPTRPAPVVESVPLQARIDLLDRRVIELESERNAAREAAAVLESQLAEARSLRDDTLARFQEVVSQLNAVRAERDRLARAQLTLEADLRAARAAAARGEPAPIEVARVEDETATDSGGFLSRFLSSISSDAAAGAGSSSVGSRSIDVVVAGFEVAGVTKSEHEEKVILDGRVVRAGDVVDSGLGLMFDRIEGDALIFKDRRGREYRRRF